MNGFKITTDRRSIFARGEAEKQYPKGVRVEADMRLGPLLVFETREQAEAFQPDGYDSDAYTIVPCNYTPHDGTHTKLEHVTLKGGLFSLEELVEKIRNKREALPGCVYSWPDGTALATEVTCLE